MRKVLLVDDVVIIRNLLLNIFKSVDELSDFKVFTASSAEEALDVILDEDLDAIVLDWMLPEKSGLDLARDIKARGIRVPILMMSSISEKNKVKEAVHEGVKDYLVKPIVKDEFVKRILKIVNES